MPRRCLCDATWASVRIILEQIPGIWKSDEKKLRKFVEAVAYVLRTGIAWPDLPEGFGKADTVQRRYRRWARKGVWKSLFDAFASNGDGTVMIDSTYIKTQRSAVGARGGKNECIGRSRGGLTTKIHTAIDGFGKFLRFHLTPGNAADSPQAGRLIEGLPMTHLLADRAYDTNALRATIADAGAVAVIPSKKNRRVQIPHDEEIYKTRHRIENVFCRLKDFTRVALRRDKTSTSYEGFVHLAAALVNIRLDRLKLCP